MQRPASPTAHPARTRLGPRAWTVTPAGLHPAPRPLRVSPAGHFRYGQLPRLTPGSVLPPVVRSLAAGTQPLGQGRGRWQWKKLAQQGPGPCRAASPGCLLLSLWESSACWTVALQTPEKLGEGLDTPGGGARTPQSWGECLQLPHLLRRGLELRGRGLLQPVTQSVVTNKGTGWQGLPGPE